MIVLFNTFASSHEPFVEMLKDNAIPYSQVQTFSASPMAAGEVIAIAQTIVSSGAVAAVLVAWLKGRATRKVIINTRSNDVIHLEGYSVKEVQTILASAGRVAVFDTASAAAQPVHADGAAAGGTPQPKNSGSS